MRLIDADALVAELKWLQSQVSSTSAVEIAEYIDRINAQPTVDAVAVVRCKDCKHGDYSGCGIDGVLYCMKHSRFMVDDNSCSYGEGRERA
jgi:hypothetical protein